MTNYHVLNKSGRSPGIYYRDAKVRFDAIADDEFSIQEILFEHTWRNNGLDTTVFSIRCNLSDAQPLDIRTHRLPQRDQQERVYLIGYPLGGELKFSIQDNHLLDHEGPPDGTPPEPSCVRVHYFAPTEPGNSGSPVFNEHWKCIALHHAGRKRELPKSKGMKRLNGQRGRYSANEGIWLGSIKAMIESQSLKQ